MEEAIDVVEGNDLFDEERENSEGDDHEEYDESAGIDWSRLRYGGRRRPVSRTWHDDEDGSDEDDDEANVMRVSEREMKSRGDREG